MPGKDVIIVAVVNEDTGEQSAFAASVDHGSFDADPIVSGVDDATAQAFVDAITECDS